MVMAKIEVGNELCEYITGVLNNIITTTGKQIAKDNKEIWDGFLHKVDNEDWAAMFEAFKHKLANSDQFLSQHQQDKFDRAYTTFKRDSQLRERCMDIRTQHKNTKDLAWAMIHVIREVWNADKGIDIPNVDQPQKATPKTARQIKEYRREINITIQERLFEI